MLRKETTEGRWLTVRTTQTVCNTWQIFIWKVHVLRNPSLKSNTLSCRTVGRYNYVLPNVICKFEEHDKALWQLKINLPLVANHHRDEISAASNSMESLNFPSVVFVYLMCVCACMHTFSKVFFLLKFSFAPMLVKVIKSVREEWMKKIFGHFLAVAILYRNTIQLEIVIDVIIIYSVHSSSISLLKYLNVSPCVNEWL